MKGSHSRQSHRPDERYSNIAQVQGGMITDADLNEAGQLHQSRDEAHTRVTVGSGIPAEGGMLVLNEQDVLFQDGAVVADGKLGQFRLLEGKAGSLQDAVAAQIDLPFGPEAPEEALVYMDLWERPIFAVEDAYLSDVGLHGAETSYRTRTMVQMKTLPASVKLKPGQLEALVRSHPAFKQTGDVQVHLAEISSSFRPVDCDPCADEISIDAEPPNALFRLEVIRVERNKKGEATSVQLAWSFENGEAIERIENADALERENHLYESFSPATESQMGYFDAGQNLLERKISPTVPEASNEEPKPTVHRYTHVRRWNGEVTVATDGRRNPQGHNKAAVSFDNGKTVISTDYFRILLDLSGRDILIGDYWLVEMRRYAPEGERLRLNHGHFGTPSGPLGPVHHLLPLFPMVKDAAFLPDDATRRRLTMPALSDLPSTHIAYQPPEDCELLDGTQTTKEALDRLCGLNASHVGFDGSKHDCDTLEDATNVEDALLRLCEADKKSQTQLMLRSMMDWGVVAGIKVLRDGNELTVSEGVALDRMGILHEIERQAFDLKVLTEKNIFPNKLDLQDVQKSRGEICLCIGFNGKERTFFLTDPLVAYDLDDLTMKDQIEACLDVKFEKGQSLLTSETLKGIINNKDESGKEVLTKIHIAFRRDLAPIRGLGLDKREAQTAQEILQGMVKEIAARVTKDVRDRIGATLNRIAEEASKVKEKLTLEQHNLLFAGLTYAAIINFDEEHRIQCICDNIVPPMPETEGGWTLVPIAGIVLSKFGFGQMELEKACMTSCRKQSHNWRSFRYYYGDTIQHIFDAFDDTCCEGKLSPRDNTTAELKRWFDGRGTAPWDGETDIPMWPIIPTYDNAPPEGDNLEAGRLKERGGWKNGANPDILNVNGKKIDEAMAMLKAAKFVVVDKPVNINELQAIFDLAENRMPLLNRRPQAGDTVVLVTDNVMAIEFVVLRQNRSFIPGRLDFKPWKVLGTVFPTLAVNRNLKNIQVKGENTGKTTSKGTGKANVVKGKQVLVKTDLLKGTVVKQGVVADLDKTFMSNPAVKMQTVEFVGLQGQNTAKAAPAKTTKTAAGGKTATTKKAPTKKAPAKSATTAKKATTTTKTKPAGTATKTATTKAPTKKTPPKTTTTKKPAASKTKPPAAKTTKPPASKTTKPAGNTAKSATTKKAPAKKAPPKTRASAQKAKLTGKQAQIMRGAQFIKGLKGKK